VAPLKQLEPATLATQIRNTKIVQRYIRIANLDKRNTTEDMGL
jgi:hypothetical protein